MSLAINGGQEMKTKLRYRKIEYHGMGINHCLVLNLLNTFQNDVSHKQDQTESWSKPRPILVILKKVLLRKIIYSIPFRVFKNTPYNFSREN